MIFNHKINSREDGQAMVEFAIVVPVLLMVVLGIIQFGILFNHSLTLTDAVRAGARQGSGQPNAPGSAGGSSGGRGGAGAFGGFRLAERCRGSGGSGGHRDVHVRPGE